MQVAWASVVLLFAALHLATGRLVVGGAIMLAGIAYVYATVALLRRETWAWWFCLSLPIVSLAMYGPNVGYGLWRASQLDPLFADSPASLLVLLITAFAFVIPPVLILLRLMIMRRGLSSA
jgi:hypothetical protein